MTDRAVAHNNGVGGQEKKEKENSNSIVDPITQFTLPQL
jgi:hypothetical protein